MPLTFISIKLAEEFKTIKITLGLNGGLQKTNGMKCEVSRRFQSY